MSDMNQVLYSLNAEGESRTYRFDLVTNQFQFWDDKDKEWYKSIRDMQSMQLRIIVKKNYNGNKTSNE